MIKFRRILTGVSIIAASSFLGMAVSTFTGVGGIGGVAVTSIIAAFGGGVFVMGLRS